LISRIGAPFVNRESGVWQIRLFGKAMTSDDMRRKGGLAMTQRIYIDGDQGTTGLQIVQRLRGRTDLQLLTLPEAQRKDPRQRAEMLNACDIALLCLPDAAAREAVAWVHHPQVRILDASSAHRVQAGWVYGLPELQADQAQRIAAAHRVSNPGCYATAAIALLRPLRDAGLLPADHPVVVQACSGYSGRGRDGIEAYEGAQAAAQPPFQVYALQGDHKHVPEIQQHAGLAHPPLFVPSYGAYAQGIVLTIALHRRLLPHAATPARVHEALRQHHDTSAAVQVLPRAGTAAPQHLDPRALNGTDQLQLMVFDDRSGTQILLAAVLDNLGKGAAGAAVQNLGLMLGRKGHATP
jgi:N-acetyl-gamma-glutamyl-phosphate reductase